MRQLPHALRAIATYVLRAIALTTYVADCEWGVWKEKKREAS